MAEKNCPACRTSPLGPAIVEPGLIGLGCGRCHGHWVSADNYWKWVDRHPPAEPTTDDTVHVGVDSGPAKRCPDCGHFLAHLKVGRGVPFHLDHCSTCGGMWFDAGEWMDLRRRGIRPHEVFSPAWQAAVVREERAAAHEADMRERLGEADYAEAQRVRAWIAAHPQRAALIAYVTPAEGLTPANKAADVIRGLPNGQSRE